MRSRKFTVNATVSGVLQLARSENIRCADLAEILARPLALAQAEFDRRGAISTYGGLSAPVIRGDPGALRRLFPNLLLNAGQALGPGGHARLHIETPDDRVVVVLEDMAPEFRRGARSRSRAMLSTKSDGTGQACHRATHRVRAWRTPGDRQRRTRAREYEST